MAEPTPTTAAPAADDRPYSPGLEGVLAGETALGYVDGNIRVVVWALNMAKSGWGDDVLLRLAHAIVDVNRKTGV